MRCMSGGGAAAEATLWKRSTRLLDKLVVCGGTGRTVLKHNRVWGGEALTVATQRHWNYHRMREGLGMGRELGSKAACQQAIGKGHGWCGEAGEPWCGEAGQSWCGEKEEPWCGGRSAHARMAKQGAATVSY
eukprot:366546-Chlamydomonas_euryale.AAC.38